MSYLFADHLLLRMPAKSAELYTLNCQHFLDDPLFRAALYMATPAFYEQVSRRNFDFEKLGEKEKNTIRKYINRFCFRPIPFGLFSSVTLVEWGTSTQLSIAESPHHQAILLADQAFVTAIGQALLNQELRSSATFEANPSLYRVLNEYRFFRTGVDAEFKKRDYQLQSIGFSKLIKDLIAFCRKGRSRQEIVFMIIDAAACTPAEAEDYFEFLTDAQLLINKLIPNITGPDYLSRLIAIPGIKDNPTGRVTGLASLLAQLIRREKIIPDYFIKLNSVMKALSPEGQHMANIQQLSVILKQKISGASLDSGYQEQIRDGIFALDVLCPDDEFPAMAQFIKTFRQHFDGQKLPLLVALDPEAGINYQEPSPENPNPLLETLNIRPRKSTKSSLKWTPAHACIMESWHKSLATGHSVIRLNKEDLEKVKGNREDISISGLSVLFRIAGQQIFLESAGGINAPALMGRFTVAGEEIESAAKEMARLQEAANPDIIFAELLHLGDPHSDNVNRRECIWSYELPITAASTLPADRQLSLSDLYVSIENNKAVLRSEKYGKMVVPRLTSAYNHSLNKLPLFRFLADLPYQYGRYNLGLDLYYFFPGLSFYPRVEYLNTVLCLATWYLNEATLQPLQQTGNAAIFSAFGKVCSELKLPAAFLLADGDQQLLFFRERKEDILFFASCVRQKKEVIIKEYLAETSCQALVRDAAGNPFVHQFNAYLIPSGPAVLPKASAIPIQKKVQRKFMPGSEWLFLKIYIPKAGSARLLLKILPLIRRKYPNGKVKKWFFIRYEDHAPHIRLRLMITPDALSDVLIAFKTQLEDKIYQNLIREYQVDIYNRELERYRLADMTLAEDFFCASSELVVKMLRNRASGLMPEIYLVALRTVRDMIAVFLPEQADQLVFTEGGYRHFLAEFEDGPIRFELDKRYRELSTSIQSALKEEGFYRQAKLQGASRSLNKTVRALHRAIKEKEEGRPDYLKSLIHMHLNRIFTDESRKQEMIIYYLLYKYLLSEKGRNKLKPE
ncbi:MAG TPA: lantibiotic dehydratase [Mucilaginibacter sp.]|jgi:thiopeptide-type bacteriocin biosynthesis protein